ncbi:MAG: ABC transporter substrate-binding protein [Gammaproteobacteria bacterium]|nr:ABC transporter substrate-binding protein [Gammaproteobacteria bacterium]
MLSLLIASACENPDSVSESKDASKSLNLSTADQIENKYLLPERLLKSGKLVVGVVPQFQPMAFYPEGTGELAGSDPEMMTAIAKKLGLSIEWFPVSFDAMLAGIASRRFDVAITGISDTPERQEHITFIDYMMEAKIFLTLARNPAAITEALSSSCGHTIAVQRGTVDPEYLQIVNDACNKEGLPEAKSLEFTSSSDKKLAVQSARVDVSFFSSVDFPALQQESGDAFAAFVLPELPEELWGIAVNPNDKELANAILKATQEIMDDGSYIAILKKWNVTHLALEAAAINAGK